MTEWSVTVHRERERERERSQMESQSEPKCSADSQHQVVRHASADTLDFLTFVKPFQLTPREAKRGSFFFTMDEFLAQKHLSNRDVLTVVLNHKVLGRVCL